MPDAPADPEPDPAASDSAGVARLVQLTHVWHLVSLHHPAVAVRGAPFDSAFIRAVTLVRRAQDPALLQVAYARFLAALNDPLTRVEPLQAAGTADRGSAADVAAGEISVERTADSILVVTMPTATRYSSRAEVALRDALVSAPARVVLDLRTSGPAADPDSLDAFIARMELGERLATVPFSRSTVRVRRVGGARDVQGTWTYDDSWLGRDGVLVAARSTTPKRVMVIASAGTVLPRAVLGLIATGRGTLIGEGPLRDDALVPSVQVGIGQGACRAHSHGRSGTRGRQQWCAGRYHGGAGRIGCGGGQCAGHARGAAVVAHGPQCTGLAYARGALAGGVAQLLRH